MAKLFLATIETISISQLHFRLYICGQWGDSVGCVVFAQCFSSAYKIGSTHCAFQQLFDVNGKERGGVVVMVVE